MTPPIQLSTSLLEESFANLITFIKSHKIKNLKYSGLVVHVNNFDIILSDKDGKDEAIKFFDEIRDVLQTPDVYFYFWDQKIFSKMLLALGRELKVFLSNTFNGESIK